MIADAVRSKLEEFAGEYIDQHLIEREAFLDAFIGNDQECVRNGLLDDESRALGFTGEWAPYVMNVMGDHRNPFTRVPGASRMLRLHVARAVADGIDRMAKQAATVEDKVQVTSCVTAASPGIGVVAHVSPTGGGVFTAHVGLRFRYSARTGGWRPAVLMMLDDAELPDGSRPPTLVGPRVLRVFAELQAPANRAGVDRMTINDL